MIRLLSEKDLKKGEEVLKPTVPAHSLEDEKEQNSETGSNFRVHVFSGVNHLICSFMCW